MLLPIEAVSVSVLPNARLTPSRAFVQHESGDCQMPGSAYSLPLPRQTAKRLFTIALHTFKVSALVDFAVRVVQLMAVPAMRSRSAVSDALRHASLVSRMVSNRVNLSLRADDSGQTQPLRNPFHDGVGLDVGEIGQVGGGERLTRNLNLPGASGVAHLPRPIGPPAVLNRVIAVIVDTVNGIATRWNSHVSNKVSVGIKPSVTDLNPAPAVVMVVGIIRVAASLLHIIPHAVDRRDSLKRHRLSPSVLTLPVYRMEAS